ncbi:adhesion G protein-coupled receptor L3-like [Acanthaster planci]|uniref:Adhesion G protein-coupled receptor L3-like n=1 Tax=Acanthaster planci TaxID=133434 RepID=A0A8B7XUE1_ACAPL|nr:adhesion G protein-coupled receptor L3-like [Acanthaster planci]
MSLTEGMRYAIGPFPPCQELCYFLIGEIGSTSPSIGSVACDIPLPFVCEGELIYEDPHPTVNVSTSALSPDSITVSWSRPATGDLTGFRVTLDAAASVHRAGQANVNASGTLEAVFTGLSGGTRYTAAVITVNGPKESDSVVVSASTFPNQIPCLQTVAGDKEIAVSWVQPTGGVDGYTLELSGMGSRSQQEVSEAADINDGEALEYEFRELRKDSTYDLVAYAWVRYNGIKLYSATVEYQVTTTSKNSQEEASAPCDLIVSTAEAYPPGTTEVHTHADYTTPATFCPEVDFDEPTTFPRTTLDASTPASTTSTTMGQSGRANGQQSGATTLAPSTTSEHPQTVESTTEGQITLSFSSTEGIQAAPSVSATIPTLPIMPTSGQVQTAGSTDGEATSKVSTTKRHMTSAMASTQPPLHAASLVTFESMPTEASTESTTFQQTTQQKMSTILHSNHVKHSKSVGVTVDLSTTPSTQSIVNQQTEETKASTVAVLTLPITPHFAIETTTKISSPESDMQKVTPVVESLESTADAHTASETISTAHVSLEPQMVLPIFAFRTSSQTTRTTTDIVSTESYNSLDPSSSAEHISASELSVTSSSSMLPTSTSVESSTEFVDDGLSLALPTGLSTPNPTSAANRRPDRPPGLDLPTVKLTNQPFKLTTAVDIITEPFKSTGDDEGISTTVMYDVQNWTKISIFDLQRCLVSTSSSGTKGHNSMFTTRNGDTVTELIVSILEVFLNKSKAITPLTDITALLDCVYDMDVSLTMQKLPWPSIIEALLETAVQSLLPTFEATTTIRINNHRLAGGTEIEVVFTSSENGSCAGYQTNRTHLAKPSVHLPASVIDNNGKQCRSLLVFNMESLHSIMPPENCVDNSAFICEELSTPFPLITVALIPPTSLPFAESMNIEFFLPVTKFTPVCVWAEAISRDGQPGSYSWNTSGCDTLIDTKTFSIICRCSHLTSFTVVMKVTDFENDEKHERALHLITMAGCIVSILSACLTIMIYLCLRILKEEKVIHVQLLLAIAVAQLIFLFGIDQTENQVLCTIIAVSLFYFMSSTFTWMLMEVTNLYMNVVKVFTSGTNMKVYFLAGWGLPLIQVSVSYGVSASKLLSTQYCWLSVQSGVIWAFVGPALIIVAINTVMLVAVLWEISRILKRDITNLKAGKFRTLAKALLVFTPMVGLPWLFGLLAFNTHLIVFDYIFTVLNSFQGLVLFSIFILGNREVRGKIRGRVADAYSTSAGTRTMHGVGRGTRAGGMQLTSHGATPRMLTISNTTPSQRF